MMVYLLRQFFTLAGVPRCGTTSLAHILNEHPDLQVSKGKENGFFDMDNYFHENGIAKKGAVDCYHQYYYNFYPEFKYYFDASTIYSGSEKAMQRLQIYRPDMKVIILFKNPIIRAYSHWITHADNGGDNLSFGDAIRSEYHRFCETPILGYGLHAYATKGFYSDTIRMIWKYFEKNQVLAIKSEDLFLNSQNELNKICDFLDISKYELSYPFPRIPSRRKALNADSIPDKDREYLENLYEFPIKDLERILDWDCSDWL